MLQREESVAVRVQAVHKWNDTKIELVAGHEYEFLASGEWVDLHYRSGPAGYDSASLFLRACERLRRAPNQRWFMLMGAIEKRSPLIPIGTGGRFSAVDTGILYCFANDVPGMYWNNSGEVTLAVTRTR